ncbi:LOW QUALITY PROTEIN: sodium channel protein type 4 subunit alpha B-like [Clavelina lepadiformis]|uniref:LOW QUALITY PROTEIN: sodium channel protein type 4 subunit alpha B-like n=1 Tax=Clavelina lepadiformis TaxID=159417 RepID=UPI0040423DEF
MVMNGNQKEEWAEKVENVFTFVYTFEALVKIVGRGFVLHDFSYLRDAWNCLDFLVIIAAYGLIILGELATATISGLTFLRAIRVLRIFKTVSAIPGLRMIVSALVASTKALRDAMLLSLLGFSMFSLVGIQLFRGTLQQKCVLLPPHLLLPLNCAVTSLKECTTLRNLSDDILRDFGSRSLLEVEHFISRSADLSDSLMSTASHESLRFPSTSTSMMSSNNLNASYIINEVKPLVSVNVSLDSSDYEFSWNKWIEDEDHFIKDGPNTYQLCGNQSSALHCPTYATCLRVGDNPNFGYTSFDNFHFAFLSVFRLSLQDNWEELYLQTLQANGGLAWFFFFAMIFLGTYYLINLNLAVVAFSYEEQRKSVANSLEEEKRELLQEKEILTKRRNATNVSSIQHQTINLRKTKTMFKRDWCWCYRFKNIFLLWTCCVGNSSLCRIREKLRTFFMKPTAEMLTVVLVILNTVVMAMEQWPKDRSLDIFLGSSNRVFTALFAVEMFLKMFALSPYHYFKKTWNIFDFVVVTLSLLEIAIADKLPNGLSVLRTFRLIRLVRILKLAKSWPTLSKLMGMIADSLSKVGYLTLVLLIVLVIFALAGMQTVGSEFYKDKVKGIPLRWHMNDFWHAFFVVFRIQCGEWIQSMWSCMHSVRDDSPAMVPMCVFVFLGVVFVGNLVVLNLFLALLLNSFSSDALNSGGGKSKSAKKVLKSLRSAGRKVIGKKRKIAPYAEETKNEAKVEKIDKKAVSTLGKIDDSKDGLPVGLLERSELFCTTNRHHSLSSLNHIAPIEKERESNETVFPVTILSEVSDENKLKDETSNISNGVLISVHNHSKTEANGCNNNSVNTPKHDMISTRATMSGSDSSVSIRLNQVVNQLPVRNGSSSMPEISFQLSADEEGGNLLTSTRGKKSNKAEQEKEGLSACMNKVVRHDVFESFLIFIILLSSVSLVFEDVHLASRPKLKIVLSILDRVFTAIFFVEMIMKWIGFGLKKYFTNGWCLLDFAIVVVSLISLALEIIATQNNASSTDLSSLRVLRSLRAFRPLRAMSRFRGIKVVTDALFRSIPSIFNVFMICLVFWLIFAIMGVNFFAGKMASCRWKESGEKVWARQDYENHVGLENHYPRPPIDVTNRSSCLQLANLTGGKVIWKNLHINFDNVAISYVALLQVATFKGWMPIMYAAVDAPGEVNQQPIRDNNVAYYAFFVAFIIFGAFFTLNLFISVVIDNFNQQKKKFELSERSLFITESQQKAYDAIKNMKTKLPRKLNRCPQAAWRERLYLVVTGDKFELVVLVVTLLNLVGMAVEHNDMTEVEEKTLKIINYAFVGVFSVEIALRMTAMGKFYFYSPWNIFDFFLILTSLLINVISSVIIAAHAGSGDPISTSPWLPMLRMIRVVRILRVARVASGVRTLLFALMLSIPALFNIGSLLFLFMFIYAIFGMSQFGHVEKSGAINEILNFETFPSTMLLLFQMSTSAGWDGFMEPTLYVEEPDCSSGLDGSPRTCMSTTFLGYFYFISYLLLTFVIITNMYIAVILENFDVATKDHEKALTADDFEHFFDMWQRFDKKGRGKLSLEQLSDLLHVVDRPLRMKQPNKMHIANMRIPMCKGHKLFIVDVAAALIKNILGTEGFSEEMEKELKSYYQRHANKSLRADDGLRVTDTYSFTMARDGNENAVCKASESDSSESLRSSCQAEDFQEVEKVHVVELEVNLPSKTSSFLHTEDDVEEEDGKKRCGSDRIKTKGTSTGGNGATHASRKQNCHSLIQQEIAERRKVFFSNKDFERRLTLSTSYQHQLLSSTKSRNLDKEELKATSETDRKMTINDPPKTCAISQEHFPKSGARVSTDDSTIVAVNNVLRNTPDGDNRKHRISDLKR